jgi:hypothetical protein
MATVYRALPVQASSPGYGNNNGWIGGANCNDPDLIDNVWYDTTAITSAQGWGTTGRWTWQLNVQSVQTSQDYGTKYQSNDNYQFTALVGLTTPYELTWFTVDVWFPNGQQNSLNTTTNISGAYWLNSASSPVEIYMEPVFSSNNVATQVNYIIDVNGVEQQTLSIPLPQTDQKYTNQTDQASPSQYQNVLVGDPYVNPTKLNDPVVNFLNGAGEFYSYSSSNTYNDTSSCSRTPSGWGTSEDSNMEYNTADCSSSECIQTFSVPSSGGASALLIQSVNQYDEPITGYYNAIYTTGGTLLAHGYTPFGYGDGFLTYDDEYYAVADSYEGCTFEQPTKC